jgi:hypothetical protein
METLSALKNKHELAQGSLQVLDTLSDLLTQIEEIVVLAASVEGKGEYAYGVGIAMANNIGIITEHIKTNLDREFA